jgi:hypothetical protein
LKNAHPSRTSAIAPKNPPVREFQISAAHLSGPKYFTASQTFSGIVVMIFFNVLHQFNGRSVDFDKGYNQTFTWTVWMNNYFMPCQRSAWIIYLKSDVRNCLDEVGIPI